MRLKQLLCGIAAAMIALTAPQLVAPATATAATDHFVRFSNKYPAVMKWCVKAFDKNNREIKSDCDQVPVRDTSTFFVPSGADHIRYGLGEAVDSGEGVASGRLANNRDWCFRYTISGTFHEAKDKPCKL